MANKRYGRPKWEEPDMTDWDERFDDWDEGDMRDDDRLCSPLAIGLGVGFIAGYGCYPRRHCYPRYYCYPRSDCYPRRYCYPRCYPR